MFPTILEIGPLTLRTYGVLVALGFLAAIFVALRRASGHQIDRDTVLDLGFYVILSAIIGSRIFFVLQTPSYYLANPWKILKIWEGGLVFYGGLIGALAGSIIYLKIRKLSFLNMADLCAPSISLGQAIGRLGCFSAGCCYGLPWEGACSVAFRHPETLAPSGISLHPTQLYASGANFLIFLILLFIDRHRRFTGQTFFSYLILYPSARFILEFFRGDERGAFFGTVLSPAQVISLAAMAVGVLGMIILSRRERGKAG